MTFETEHEAYWQGFKDGYRDRNTPLENYNSTYELGYVLGWGLRRDNYPHDSGGKSSRYSEV